MTALRADRRLYETAERDGIVEEGDVRSRWLIAGVGSTIGESDVEKYGLTFEGGRVRYEGCPALEDIVEEKEAAKPEDKAATEHEDKAMTFGGEDPEDPGDSGEEPEESGDSGEEPEGSDDSDRNDEPPPKWPLKSTPEEYLAKSPDGPKAELALTVIAARDDGADGGP